MKVTIITIRLQPSDIGTQDNPVRVIVPHEKSIVTITITYHDGNICREVVFYLYAILSLSHNI